ncbi:MAG: bifunctional hydroxymethylpyrimidine kinase/phosphomethylpyrimidine kinase [Deltaproteobacteria bacterium]|nr:bifunctional hydroxymethylpyrimidine kinase/phosphomethylpyrimidine kinase [Deltaproteobacteria bacterium]
MKAGLMPKVLLIAGLDPSGHAGIIADIRTVTAFGILCSGVITSITDQTENRYYASQKVTPDMVKKQLSHLFEKDKFDSIKVGMLSFDGMISVISGIFTQLKPLNIVLDPVLISTTGGELLEKDALNTLRERLLPLCDILTPNVPEAERLTGLRITSIDDMLKAGKILVDMGCKNVMIKGGHIMNNAADILITGKRHYIIEGDFIPESDFRGTGCVLSSAVAALLAKGYKIRDAVTKAKSFLENARRNPVYDSNSMRFLNVFTEMPDASK